MSNIIQAKINDEIEVIRRRAKLTKLSVG